MIKELLDSVQLDFQKPESHWIHDTVQPDDIDAVRTEATDTNPWDVLKIRLSLWDALQRNEASLHAYSCTYGRIIILSKGPAQQEPPSSWIRIFRLLGTSSVRVIWFASDIKRLPPPVNTQIGPSHINGGYTMRCNMKSIVIYRKEEATRVLIHEMLHASCTDIEDSLPNVEADTEAWAEVILVAIAAKGEPTAFNRLWDIQAKYAVGQATSAIKYHKIKGQEDYSWRYSIGRIDCFKLFGLPLPSPPKNPPVLKSLRLTDKKLEDIINIKHGS